MRILIETVTTKEGKLDCIRDVDGVMKVVEIAQKAFKAIRNSCQCEENMEIPRTQCDACKALAEWDALCGKDK